MWNGPGTKRRAASRSNIEEKTMHKDRIEGSAKQVIGSVKEVIGKVTGDTKMQAQGSAEKMAGKLQKAFGQMRDAVCDAANLDHRR
jgi:uncharacterized protein YjbJ (UPF0337 family)